MSTELGFEPFGAGDPNFVRTFKPRTPDFGTLSNLSDSAVMSFRSSFGVQGSVYVADWLRDRHAEIQGETPIEEDEFEAQYSLGGQLKWEEGMSRSRAEAMFQRTLKDHALSYRMRAGGHKAAQLIGGLAGGFADPANLVVSALLPQSNFFRLSQGASVAARASRTLRVLDRAGNAAAAGFRDSLAMETPNVFVSYANQRPLGMEEFFINIGASTAFGAIFRGTLATGQAALAPELDQVMARAYMANAMGSRNPDIFKAAVGASPKTRASAEAAEGLAGVTAEQVRGTPGADDAASFAVGQLDPNTLGPRRSVGESKFLYEQDMPDGRKASYWQIGMNADPDNPRGRTVDLDTLLREGYDVSFLTDAEGASMAAGVSRTRATEPRLPEGEITRRNAIAKAIREDPTTRRHASNDDEAFVKEVWRGLFGVDVHFIDKALAEKFAVNGFVEKSDPNTIYIRGGEFSSGMERSMAFLAGHELAHTIRLRNQHLWMRMAGAMIDAHDDVALAQAYSRVIAHKNNNSVWGSLSTAGKMDETFANTFGQAMLSRKFWQSLSRSDPRDAANLRGWVQDAVDGVSRVLGTSLGRKQTRAGTALYRQLGEMVTAADEAGVTLAQNRGLDPNYRNLESLYSEHRETFRDSIRRIAPMLNDARLQEMVRTDVIIDELVTDNAGEYVDKSAGLKTDRFARSYMNRRMYRGQDPRDYILRALFARRDPGTPEGKLAQEYLAGLLGGARDALDQPSDPLVFIQRNQDGTYNFHVLKNDNFPLWRESLPDELPTRANLLKQEFLFDKFHGVRKAFQDWIGSDPSDMDPDELLKAERDIDRALRRMPEEFHAFLRTMEPEEIAALTDAGADDAGPDALWHAYREFLTERLNRTLNDLPEPDLRRFEEAQTAYRKWAVKRRAEIARGTEDEGARLVAVPKFADWLSKESGYGKIQGAAELFDDIDRIDGVIRTFDEVEEAPGARDTARVAQDRKFAKEVAGVMRKGSATYSERLARLRTLEMPDLGAARNRIDPLGQPDFLEPHLDPATVRERYEEAWNQVREDIRNRLDDYIGESAVARIREQAGLQGLEATEAQLGRLVDRLAHEQLMRTGNFPDYDRIMAVDALAEGDLMHGLSLDGTVARAGDTEQLDRLLYGGVTRPEATDLDDVFYMPARRPGEEFTRAAEADERQRNATARMQINRQVQEHADLADFIGDKRPERQLEEAKALMSAPVDSHNRARHTAAQAEISRIEHWQKQSEQYLSEIENGQPPGETPNFWQEQIVHDLEYNLRNTATKTAAFEATRRNIEELRASEVLSAATAYRAMNELQRRRIQGASTVYSYLDGRFRAGVRRAGDSVAARMRTRQLNLLAPLDRALSRLGLQEAWRDNSLLPVLFAHIKGTKVSSDPAIRELADIYVRTWEISAARLNSRGAHIKTLPGYLFSHVHSHSRMRNAGFDAWAGDMQAWLDWEKTARVTGIENTPKARGVYLRAVYDEIVNGEGRMPENFDPETSSGNMANRVSRSRSLYFANTHEFDYDMNYGSGNTSGNIFAQLMRRAEVDTLMESFGKDFRKTWTNFMGDLVKTPPTAGLKEKIMGAVNLPEWKRMQGTFDMLTGDLNHPVNVKMGAQGRALRGYTFSSIGWMSGVSSLVDQSHIFSTLRWTGMGMKDLERGYFASLKRMASTPEGRDFVIAHGAGLQAALNAYSRLHMDGGFYKFAGELSDLTYKYSGLDMGSRISQMAMMDVMTQGLGRAATTEPSAAFYSWLGNYGITKDAWLTMAQYAADVDGLPGRRLAPDMIPDRLLAEKLAVALNDTISHGVLEPSVSDRALLTINPFTGNFTKAGTFEGEAIRTSNQFKGYPMAVVRKTLGRFNNGYQGWDNPMMERLVWGSVAVSLAAGVLAIKDILRGREPFNIFDSEQWTWGNAQRLVAQAGTGPIAGIEQFLSPDNIAGPAFGLGSNIAGAALNADGYRLTNATIGALPGASIAPLREMQRAIFSEVFPEAYGARYQAFLSRLEGEGQTSLLLEE